MSFQFRIRCVTRGTGNLNNKFMGNPLTWNSFNWRSIWCAVPFTKGWTRGTTHSTTHISTRGTQSMCSTETWFYELNSVKDNSGEDQLPVLGITVGDFITNWKTKTHSFYQSFSVWESTCLVSKRGLLVLSVITVVIWTAQIPDGCRDHSKRDPSYPNFSSSSLVVYQIYLMDSYPVDKH